MKIRLPAPGTSTLTLLVSLWLLAADNFPFWRTVWSAVGGLRADNVLFVVALPWLALA